MSCLHLGVRYPFWMRYTTGLSGLPMNRPCWKVFTGHVVKGTKTYRTRVPLVETRSHMCHGGLW